MPAEYDSALLELTNAILATLDHESSRQATLDTDERCYRMLYAATPAMLHSIDSEGRLVSVSEVWLTALGYTIRNLQLRQVPMVEALADACMKHARAIVMTTVAMTAGMLPSALGFGADASFRQRWPLR
ncbi:hypothetical protein SAMN05192563_1004170 [Paraburkholderia aspalathi]|uniref:PAS domain-containing protein n=1 Tax=Paraburkholderia aspalathi TaxID=1324617 RepID=A0A1I7B4M2_9BURK|nr:hypothetical protein SAMN05192563_1004170 [Paraburkholderia aspalathi]